MSQQRFSEEQRKEIKDMIYGILYNSSKERGYFILDVEKNLYQKTDNVEATQRIILENQQLNKSLFTHRFDKLEERFDKLEGKIDQGFNSINKRFDNLESKLS